MEHSSNNKWEDQEDRLQAKPKVASNPQMEAHLRLALACLVGSQEFQAPLMALQSRYANAIDKLTGHCPEGLNNYYPIWSAEARAIKQCLDILQRFQGTVEDKVY